MQPLSETKCCQWTNYKLQERHLHYFLNSCWDIPPGCFPFWQQCAGASSSEAIGSYGLSFDEDSVIEKSCFNDEECQCSNFTFRAVCTISDFNVQLTLLGLIWCDIKALKQPDKYIICFSCIRALLLVHLSQRLVRPYFKTGCFHSCLSSVGQIFHMMIYDPQHACRAAGGVN